MAGLSRQFSNRSIYTGKIFKIKPTFCVYLCLFYMKYYLCYAKGYILQTQWRTCFVLTNGIDKER